MDLVKKLAAVVAFLIAAGTSPLRAAADADGSRAESDRSESSSSSSARSDREREKTIKALEDELRSAEEQIREAARRLAEINAQMKAYGAAASGYSVAWTGNRAVLGVVVRTEASEEKDPIGAEIVAVTPGGPAAEAGLKAGDIITSINGQRLTNGS